QVPRKVAIASVFFGSVLSVPVLCYRLPLQHPCHILGGQRDSSRVHSCRIEDSRSDGRRHNRIRRLRTTAKALIIPRNLNHFYLRQFFHRQDFVPAPVRAGHFLFVECNFFLQRFAQPHHHPALHTAVQLPRI